MSNKPMLAKPALGEFLLLYLVVLDSVISTILVKESGRRQNLVYYTSKALSGVETSLTI